MTTPKKKKRKPTLTQFGATLKNVVAHVGSADLPETEQSELMAMLLQVDDKPSAQVRLLGQMVKALRIDRDKAAVVVREAQAQKKQFDERERWMRTSIIDLMTENSIGSVKSAEVQVHFKVGPTKFALIDAEKVEKKFIVMQPTIDVKKAEMSAMKDGTIPDGFDVIPGRPFVTIK